jgi:hypothetical protein
MKQEYVRSLLKLISENPELPILPMVYTDCVPSDDFASWAASWGHSEIDEYILKDDRIYFKSEDYDELVDMEYNDSPEDITDGEARKQAKGKVDTYPWVKAIIVRIYPFQME